MRIFHLDEERLHRLIFGLDLQCEAEEVRFTDQRLSAGTFKRDHDRCWIVERLVDDQV